MKILHIHPAMKGGGVESMICGLANQMSKTEDVTVCSIFEPTLDDIFWNKLETRVKKVTLGKAKEGFSFIILIRILTLIKEGKYDVINVHGFFYYYLLSVLFLRKKTRFFYTVHSDASMENGSWSRYIFAFKKLAFIKGYVHPITISPASDESFKRVYGINGKMIENGIPRPILSHLPNIIDNSRITPHTRVFVNPGRITKAKNQVVLCRVFDTLLKDGCDVKLLIVGSKQDIGIYEQIEPYLCERIQYLGERNDIPDILSRCDGMCLPSIWEGLPVTLLEALSVGCIPICSPGGGIVNVIKNEYNGILSQSPNYEDYYLAMKHFLGLSSDTIDSIHENAINSFAPFDITVTSKKYLDYYKSFL